LFSLYADGSTNFVEYLGESFDDKPGAIVYNPVASSRLFIGGQTTSAAW